MLQEQGCHWTFAKITENLCVHAVSQKMNTKRDRKFRKRKMKQEKIENNGKRETDRQRTDRANITEKNGKSASLQETLKKGVQAVLIMILRAHQQ